ncbi:S8 family peptidase [Saccharibacillus brassicae]|uniref:S8 family peptidase n=2 Tax=Saccharibacillus brassicae TaxID=2583377 RepID=A0A4Y6UYF2_SACBS|nr:S8 family peptidase [Saccharibacillus brassicae]
MFRQNKGKNILFSTISAVLLLSSLTFSQYAKSLPNVKQHNQNSTFSTPSVIPAKPITNVFVKYADRDGQRLALNVTHDLDYHIYWNTNMMSLRTNQAGLAKLRASDSIQSIELDRTYSGMPQSSASLSNDASAAPSAASSASKIKQGAWGYDAIDTSKAQLAGYTGKGVKIAVLDTGISNESGIQIAGGTSTIDGTPSYADDNGHGTFVAGIIGAKSKAYKGIAPDASLYAVKVMDKDGNGSTESLAQGLDWAIRQHMDVINLSLSFPQQSGAVQELLKKAADQGITVIVAAGNSGNADGSGDTIAFPAKSPEAITIAAVDSQLRRADFSGTGDKVELAAPGVGIISTSVSGKYKLGEGTSAAAPFVSGMVAVLKQAHPELGADQIRTALQQSAQDLGAPGRDTQYGFGLISFDRLLGKGSVIASAPAPAAASVSDASMGTMAASDKMMASKKQNGNSNSKSGDTGTFR